ncbi:MAG: metallophosphoesterase [Clostridia bacterium]|nr:metallophosphoesterase [Clostridia bacterium]
MRLIHTGDLHLGSAMTSLSPDKAKQRKTELMDGFRALSAFAKENGVSAVLIAGDLFDSKPTIALKKEVFSVMEQTKPVQFFYVSGNHDEEFTVGEEKPDNLHLFSDTHGWKSYMLNENVTVTGLDLRNLTEKSYADLSLDKQAFNVVMMHGDAVAAKAEQKEQISLQRLQNRYVDYLALGHIHKPTEMSQRLDGRGVWRYCGCLEGRGFDECGRRGAFLLEIENGRLISEKFLSFSKRVFTEVQVDISACNTYYDVEQTVLSALRTESSQNAVKIVLCGRHSAGLKKETALLTQRLSERFFFVRVEDTSKVYVDYNAYASDMTERGEFVREVGRCAMNEEIKLEILEIGLKALAGEEIDL